MNWKPRALDKWKPLARATGIEITVIAVFCLTSLVILSNYGDYVHNQVQCQGIEQCYTNTSFWQDIACVQNTTFVPSLPKPPGKLFREGGSCQSVSNAIACLLEPGRYNRTYAFYTSLSFTNEPTMFDNAVCVFGNCFIGHLGVMVREDDEWHKLN